MFEWKTEQYQLTAVYQLSIAATRKRNIQRVSVYAARQAGEEMGERRRGGEEEREKQKKKVE